MILHSRMRAGAAGQERFPGLTRITLRNAHAVMLVYDLTNRTSFIR